MLKAYKYRFYPIEEQKQQLAFFSVVVDLSIYQTKIVNKVFGEIKNILI